MVLIFKVIYKYTLLNIQITNYIAALKMGWFGNTTMFYGMLELFKVYLHNV